MSQVLEPNAEIELKLKTSDCHRHFLNYADDVKENSIRIRFPESSYQRDVPLNRSVLRYLPAGKKHTKTASVGFVAEVSNEFGCRSMTLRSVVQLHNHFLTPINVYCPSNVRNDFTFIGQIEAGGTYNVPPSAIASEKLLFAPIG